MLININVNDLSMTETAFIRMCYLEVFQVCQGSFKGTHLIGLVFSCLSYGNGLLYISMCRQ